MRSRAGPMRANLNNWTNSANPIVNNTGAATANTGQTHFNRRE